MANWQRQARDIAYVIVIYYNKICRYWKENVIRVFRINLRVQNIVPNKSGPPFLHKTAITYFFYGKASILNMLDCHLLTMYTFKLAYDQL